MITRDEYRANVRAWREERNRLRAAALQCYQQAARSGAPEVWLDTLLAAYEGRPFDPSVLEQYDPQPLRVSVEGVIG